MTTTFTPLAGTTITTAAEQLVNRAKLNRCVTNMTFNDVVLTAHPNTNPDDIVRIYHEESARRSKAYRESPEGKAAARKQQERMAQLQRKHDELMVQLPKLDFKNDVALLDWICAYQEPSDTIGIVQQQAVVIKAFEDHGYRAGVNTGKDFKENDRKNFADYIIGQVLSCLKGPVGAVHQITHKFVEDWKKKFLR